MMVNWKYQKLRTEKTIQHVIEYLIMIFTSIKMLQCDSEGNFYQLFDCHKTNFGSLKSKQPHSNNVNHQASYVLTQNLPEALERGSILNHGLAYQWVLNTEPSDPELICYPTVSLSPKLKH